MENKFQTSFIPKRSFDETGRPAIKQPVSIFSIIAAFAITIAILGSGAIYFYKSIIEKSIVAKKAELASKERLLEPSTLDPILRTDQKIKQAETLLNDHVALSPLFGFLEEGTLKRLRFNNFTFSYLGKDKIGLTLQGEAKTYEVVAKQAEFFASSTLSGNNFRNALFSDISVDDKTGNIKFSFLTSINPSLLSYKNSLQATPRAVVVPVLNVSTSTVQSISTSTKPR